MTAKLLCTSNTYSNCKTTRIYELQNEVGIDKKSTETRNDDIRA